MHILVRFIWIVKLFEYLNLIRKSIPNYAIIN